MSMFIERLLPFGEVYGDEVIQYAADIRFSQPQLASNISDLRFQYYGVEEDAIYVCCIHSSCSATIWCIHSLDWTTGLEYWTGILDWNIQL